MSSAWTKVIVAKLMIEECDTVFAATREIDVTPGFAVDTRALTVARKAYWEKVLEQASLEYGLEGGS